MRKIFGQAVDELRGEAPVKGLKIRAWDEDFAGGDDLLGEDTTGKDGRYKIEYANAYWDAKIPGFHPGARIFTSQPTSAIRLAGGSGWGNPGYLKTTRSNWICGLILKSGSNRSRAA